MKGLKATETDLWQEHQPIALGILDQKENEAGNQYVSIKLAQVKMSN